MNHSSPTWNSFYSFSPVDGKHDPLADDHFGPHKVSHQYIQVPRGQQLRPVQSTLFRRSDFDKMIVTQMPDTDLQAIYTRVMTNQEDRGRLHHLYHEANADVHAIKSLYSHVPDFPFSAWSPSTTATLLLPIPSDKHRRLVLVDNICQMLGLANSHDTEARVTERVLEANKEGLQRCLQPLKGLRPKGKQGDRVRKDRLQKERDELDFRQQKHQLAKQIGLVFKEFSGHDFLSDGGGTKKVRVYTWGLEPLQKLPLLSQMIRAVTPLAPQLQILQSNGAVGWLTRRLDDFHLPQDPEVLQDAPEGPDMQTDSMMDNE